MSLEIHYKTKCEKWKSEIESTISSNMQLSNAMVNNKRKNEVSAVNWVADGVTPSVCVKIMMLAFISFVINVKTYKRVSC